MRTLQPDILAREKGPMSTEPEAIPVIDIRPLDGAADDPARREAVARIGRACREIGFLVITGTGVAQARIEAVRDTVRRVFAVDEAAKRAQAITRDNYRGYIPLGFFTPNDGTGPSDRYEGYKLHAETAADDPIRAECPLYGPNVWPRQVPEARSVILGYWQDLDRIADRLLGALAENLGLSPDTLRRPFVKPLTNMTLLHYPPRDAGDTGYGIHPHKDTDALTIIAPDPVGGLEVETRSGGWITAECPPDGFIVNIGDMLELWSGGRFLSTPHRVVNPDGADRYSFPYFMVPRHDVTVAPLLEPLAGFSRPAVNCGHWSAEIWRTNWPDEEARCDTPALGTLPGD